MARAGFAIEQQVAGGGNFKFEAGFGEIVEAKFVNNQVQNYDPKVELVVGIQRLDKNLRPTDDEIVYEQLSAGGNLSKLRAGNAASSDDEDPEDLGTELAIEGNALFADAGAAVDKKSKLAIFGSSLEALGFPAVLLNGFAPNLVGIKAQFTQKMLEKGANFTGKNDPTCLIATEKIFDMGPAANGIGGGSGNRKLAGKTSAPASGGGSGKKSSAPASTSTHAPAPAAAATASDNGDFSEAALAVLQKIWAKNVGKSVERGQLYKQVPVLLVQSKQPAAVKPVGALLKSDWLDTMAEGLGIVIDGDSITFPAEGPEV